MAQHPAVQFEDIPLEAARKMSRGPHMDPELYNALKGKIQSLSNTATRMTIPESASSTTMKNRILRVAGELKIPVTIRRVPGGLLFWRSTEDDFQQTERSPKDYSPPGKNAGANPDASDLVPNYKQDQLEYYQNYQY